MDTPEYQRIATAPRQSFFLFGPRGVGKSTWARNELKGAHRFDLLDEALYQSLLADPSLFADELRGVPKGGWVVVDEVQRIPALLNEVHRFIEERRLRFALLGSSARKLKTAGTNLLAGRAVRKQMFPLVPAELENDFALETVLRFGSLPLVWTGARANERARSLGPDVSKRGDPRRSAGEKLSRVSQVSSHRGTLSWAGRQCIRRGPGLGDSANDGRRLPRYSRRHVVDLQASCLRSEVARTRAQASETLLGRPWVGARSQKAVRACRRRRTRSSTRRMGITYSGGERVPQHELFACAQCGCFAFSCFEDFAF